MSLAAAWNDPSRHSGRGVNYDAISAVETTNKSVVRSATGDRWRGRPARRLLCPRPATAARSQGKRKEKAGRTTGWNLLDPHDIDGSRLYCGSIMCTTQVTAFLVA